LPEHQFKGRREDLRLVTGRGKYTTDNNVDRQAAACFLRADRAHARIVRVDTERARKSPGVLDVVTGADYFANGWKAPPVMAFFKGVGGSSLRVPYRGGLAHDRVRFVGEPVALVVAETEHQAQDAAELIDVEYEDVPVFVEAADALKPGAVSIHEDVPGNLAFDYEYGNKDNTEQGFAKAAHVVRVEVRAQRIAGNPMEPKSCLAKYDAATEQFELWAPTQGVGDLKTSLSQITGLPWEKFAIRSSDVGGAFGVRNEIYPEFLAVMLAAKRTGRPVKWIGTRSETISGDHHARAADLRGELAFDNDGNFLALRVEWLVNLGAFCSSAGPLINTVAAPTSSAASLYTIPAVHGKHLLVFTNTTPVTAYRGAGRPNVSYLWERLVEEAALKLGVDSVKLRRRNLLRKNAFPMKSATGSTYDSADPAPSGQGHETVFPALVAEVLGIPEDRIDLRYNDVAAPKLAGTGSFGSRSLISHGASLVAGAKEIVEKGKALAARELEVDPGDITFDKGEYRVAGTDRTVTMKTLMEKKWGEATHPLDTNITIDLATAFPSGAHIAEVEIDPDTGASSIVNYVAADDCGNIYNHKIVEGQLQGGLMQGIGQVFGEHIAYDPANGQLLSGTFMDYFMPRAENLSPLLMIDCGVPSPVNSLGAKGAGEAGATGAVPALANAVFDALKAVNVKHIEMPYSPARVWAAIHHEE